MMRPTRLTCTRSSPSGTGSSTSRRRWPSIPFEEPGIGPNAYQFDDNVRYAIHVSTGDDVQAGRPSITYRFDFDTTFQNPNTILQSYTGTVGVNGDRTSSPIRSRTSIGTDLQGHEGRAAGRGLRQVRTVLGTEWYRPTTRGR